MSVNLSGRSLSFKPKLNPIEYHKFQLVGFGLLILGMFIYNDLLLGPFIRRSVLPSMGESTPCNACCLSLWASDSLDDHEPLVNEDDP